MQYNEKHNHSDLLSNLKDLLYKETALFKLILARFQKKLPSDKFIQACHGVKRNLRILGSKELPLPDFRKDSTNKLLVDITKWIEYGETAVAIADSCLVALGLCQQKLRIGHITQSYSLGLGILSSIYSLCKTLTYELSQICLLATAKKKDSNQESLKDCQELLQRRLQITCSLQLEMDDEESRTQEDLGEVVARKNVTARKQEPKFENESSSIQKNVPVYTVPKKKFLKELHSAKSVKELRAIYKQLCIQMQEIIEGTKQEEILRIFRATKSELMKKKMALLSEAAEKIAEIVFSKTDTKKCAGTPRNMERKQLKGQLLACGNLLQLQRTCRSVFSSDSPVSKKVNKLVQRGLNRDRSENKQEKFRTTIAKILRTVYPVQESSA